MNCAVTTEAFCAEVEARVLIPGMLATATSMGLVTSLSTELESAPGSAVTMETVSKLTLGSSSYRMRVAVIPPATSRIKATRITADRWRRIRRASAVIGGPF